MVFQVIFPVIKDFAKIYINVWFACAPDKYIFVYKFEPIVYVVVEMIGYFPELNCLLIFS